MDWRTSIGQLLRNASKTPDGIHEVLGTVSELFGVYIRITGASVYFAWDDSENSRLLWLQQSLEKMSGAELSALLTSISIDLELQGRVEEARRAKSMAGKIQDIACIYKAVAGWIAEEQYPPEFMLSFGKEPKVPELTKISNVEAQLPDRMTSRLLSSCYVSYNVKGE